MYQAKKLPIPKQRGTERCIEPLQIALFLHLSLRNEQFSTRPAIRMDSLERYGK
jgi:hypothetical protein